MAQDEKLTQLANLANTANERLQPIREKFTRMQTELQDVSNQIRYKQLAIDGRRQQASIADQRVSQLQQEYSSLINQSYNADDNELQRIRSRIQAVRAEAQQAQAQANQYRAEAQKLEQEQRQLQAKQQQLQADIKDYQDKCRQMASHIGKYTILARRLSIQKEGVARGFSGVAQYRFGAADASSKAQWKSSEAQSANSIANRLDAVARAFRSMAASGGE